MYSRGVMVDITWTGRQAPTQDGQADSFQVLLDGKNQAVWISREILEDEGLSARVVEAAERLIEEAAANGALGKPIILRKDDLIPLVVVSVALRRRQDTAWDATVDTSDGRQCKFNIAGEFNRTKAGQEAFESACGSLGITRARYVLRPASDQQSLD